MTAKLHQEIAQQVARAADELAAACSKVPACDCERLQPNELAKVLSDLSRAEVAAAQLHREFRELEKRHTGAQLGLASLETQPLEGCVNCGPVATKPADPSINGLVSSEQTGGQGS